MDKITEREKLSQLIDNLCDEYLHMILVAAETLYNIQSAK